MNESDLWRHPWNQIAQIFRGLYYSGRQSEHKGANVLPAFPQDIRQPEPPSHTSVLKTVLHKQQYILHEHPPPPRHRISEHCQVGGVQWDDEYYHICHTSLLCRKFWMCECPIHNTYSTTCCHEGIVSAHVRIFSWKLCTHLACDSYRELGTSSV
jgi:hypothetical protein